MKGIPNSHILVYLAMSLLFHKNQKSNVIPELCMILDTHHLSTLIKVFGGETIYIPTADEFYRDLLSVLYIYHTRYDDMPEDEFIDKYRIDGYKMKSIQNRVKVWDCSVSPEEKDLLNDLKALELS